MEWREAIFIKFYMDHCWHAMCVTHLWCVVCVCGLNGCVYSVNGWACCTMRELGFCGVGGGYIVWLAI
jgi:hypothetical protein